MRKLTCFLLALMLCLPLAVGAEGNSGSGSPCGDSLTWTLTGNLLFISGKGEMYDYPNGAPWAPYKDTITTVILSGDVTAVGGYAFKDYDSITSVDFGTSLVRIGPEAFSSCDGLTSIILPASFKKFGSNAFRSCQNLGQIHLNSYCPRFDEGCLWDTYCTIYYPADKPWDSGTIAQLESAFHNRISFRPSDGSASIAPAESMIIYETTAPTQPVYVPEATAPAIYVPETTPAAQPIIIPRYTEPETIPATVPTVPVLETVPVTVPTIPVVETVPTQAATVPTAAQVQTEETFLFTQPTRPVQAAPERRATDGSSIYAVMIIVITLSIIGIGALIFQASRSSRRSRRRKKRSKR